MKESLFGKGVLLFLFVSVALASPMRAQPVLLIFDTDMGNDIDDALALAMIHALESRGEARLLAVTLTKDNRWAAPYVNVINTFYGRAHVPVGVVRDGKTPNDTGMITVPTQRRGAEGLLVYPRTLFDGAEAPEAVEVLRRTLAAQEDGSVVVVQVGFSTNLARLLDTPPDAHSPLGGRDLVARKVRLLSVMAGAFPHGDPEYNVHIDIPSARKVFDEWPTPVVASGFEVGLSIAYPSSSIERHYGYAEHHPVADGYRHFELVPYPYDRPTWDLTSVLYAVRPDEGYFDLSEPGRIRIVDEKGHTALDPSPDGPHRYLVVSDAQRLRALEAMIYLASQPPDAR